MGSQPDIGPAWILGDAKQEREQRLAKRVLPFANVALSIGHHLLEAEEVGEEFEQMRVGKDGVLFAMKKRRTIPGEDTSDTIIVGSDLAEKRGKIARRLRWDELSNLQNVVEGEMAITGPRALVPLDVKLMGEALSASDYDRWWDGYTLGLPGITCLFGLYANKLIEEGKLVPETYDYYHLRSILDPQYVKIASRKVDNRLMRASSMRTIIRFERLVTGKIESPALFRDIEKWVAAIIEETED